MLELSHVGEILISEILTRSLEARQVLRSAGCAISENLVIVPEVRPNNCGPLAFDGTHRIDVAVLDLDTRICFPFEAKLGLDRLSKNEFSKRFLNQCGTSHKDTRVRGSMISILERMLPSECNNHEMTVDYQNRAYPVSKKWGLICRAKIIKKWSNAGSPPLSPDCIPICFEDLATAYGSAQEFNTLVTELLNQDYYANWVNR